MIVLPAMSSAQAASWHGIMDLHEKLPDGWIFTQALIGLKFSASGISAEGIQHRWVRGEATIDVLLPDGVGKKAASRTGVTASPTIPTPGGTQALDRSDSVLVSVEGREGSVRRPMLVGALIMKAAAHSAVGDPAKGRHRSDFVTIASLIAARDFRGVELTKKDRRRLKDMIAAVRADAQVMSGVEDAATTLTRLERVSG